MKVSDNLVSFSEPILVTRPLLPPIEEFSLKLSEIWKKAWLTNSGDQLRILNQRIQTYLGSPNVSLLGNGTLALIMAIKALELEGEVITTPFTFPATPHALSWNGLTPVFADIDPLNMTLDPIQVEAAITSKTTAILGVHVYGNPCHVEALQTIATRHHLKLIFDAAHAFGTRVNGVPIAHFGDISAFSFHATKLFHTAEGGALLTPHSELKAKIDKLCNFGFNEKGEVDSIGINCKMNEIQAALGLVVFNYLQAERDKRKSILTCYQNCLQEIKGLSFIEPNPKVVQSYQYFPIRINAKQFGKTRDEVFEALKKYNIMSRRYFYPLCSEYPHYSHLPSADPKRLPHAHQVAQEVLCLPFYGNLSLKAVQTICHLIIKIKNQGK